MHGAMVEAAAYVLSSSTRPSTAEISVIDAESSQDKASLVYSAPASARISVEALQRIPGTPLAYWLASPGDEAAPVEAALPVVT